MASSRSKKQSFLVELLGLLSLGPCGGESIGGNVHLLKRLQEFDIGDLRLEGALADLGLNREVIGERLEAYLGRGGADLAVEIKALDSWRSGSGYCCEAPPRRRSLGCDTSPGINAGASPAHTGAFLLLLPDLTASLRSLPELKYPQA